MAIQLVDLKVPNGDTPRSANTKINANFTNQTHAASRLVGTAAGQVPLSEQVINSSLSGQATVSTSANVDSARGGDFNVYGRTDNPTLPANVERNLMTVKTQVVRGSTGAHTVKYQIGVPYGNKNQLYFRNGFNASSSEATFLPWVEVWHTGNTTKDANGFLKGASPIVKVFADKVELNDDAVNQSVSYKKNGIGDHTITTVSGLSTDGWYIELPKDMNGNPKVAVTLEETDGVISLKTYKRIFSMETFTFEPDLDNPLDIPETRWIDLRLNEIPVEEVNL